MVIVVNYYRPEAFAEAVAKAYPEVEVIACRPEAAEVFKKELARATIVVGNTGSVDLRQFPQLEWIQSFSAGINHLLTRLPQGTRLTRGIGVHDTAMAEHCLARMLAHEHRLLLAWDYQKEGRWVRYPTGRVANKVLGIAGLGSIGTALAKRASALDMTVLGLRSKATPTEHVSTVYGPDQLEEFLRDLDYLAILLPLTDKTRGMFGKKEFAGMKDGAVLISMGRGAVVNEEELIVALEEQRPAHALMDVFETEPLPPDSKLWRLPNVTITPHNAGGSQMEECVALFMHNLHAFIHGGPMRGVVDTKRQY